MLPTMQPYWFSHMWTWMQNGSSSEHGSVEDIPCPPEPTEELDGDVELAGAASELVGLTSELEGAAAELAGLSATLTAAASELLDSAAAERASTASLLSGSWLSGMSTTLLELLCLLSAWLEVAAPSVAAELPGSTWAEDSGSVTVSPPCSELADVLSSQAFSVNAAAMPNDAAMALLTAAEKGLLHETFLFSIFIEIPPYYI